MECHRTAAKHERALTSKLFWFQFTNYFAPLAYLAFLRNGFEGYPGAYNHLFGIRLLGCDGGNCTYPLAIQMVTIMLVRQCTSNFQEILVPQVISFWKSLEISGGKRKDKRTIWEQDYTLGDYIYIHVMDFW